MHVRMLTKGPHENHTEGEIVEVDKQRAANWIALGHAEEVIDGDIRPQELQAVRRRVRPVRGLE